MCFYDDEYPEFSRTTKPRARIEHVCDECGGKIAPGSVYKRVSWKYEGTLGVTTLCLPCEDVRAAIARMERSHGCVASESWCPVGEIDDYLRENHTTREAVLAAYPETKEP